MSNLKYWLWLSTLRGVSSRSALELLQQFGSPESLYYADGAQLRQAGLEGRVLAAVEERSLEEADRILGECDRLGLRILTIQDTEYPDRLKNIYDPPLLLYLKGRMPLFDEEVALAMVGTRDCSAYGIYAAETLSHSLSKQGALIVSGLAKGIDAAAHRGALRAGGVTAAVLGNGHDVIYPPENRALYEDIAATGVLLSEYPPGTRPEGKHFPVRNRIISGLCLGAVIVEAPMRSGALITAELALEQGRDVFAVPGPINSPASAGCNRLIRDGAFLAADSWDILREYAGRYPHKLFAQAVEPILPLEAEPPRRRERKAEKEEPEEAGLQLPVLDLGVDHGLTDDQVAILRALEGEMQVDDIIEATQIPARRVLSALTLLEVENYVAQSSGKRFSLQVTLQ